MEVTYAAWTVVITLTTTSTIVSSSAAVVAELRGQKYWVDVVKVVLTLILMLLPKMATLELHCKKMRPRYGIKCIKRFRLEHFKRVCVETLIISHFIRGLGSKCSMHVHYIKNVKVISALNPGIKSRLSWHCKPLPDTACSWFTAMWAQCWPLIERPGRPALSHGWLRSHVSVTWSPPNACPPGFVMWRVHLCVNRLRRAYQLLWLRVNMGRVGAYFSMCVPLYLYTYLFFNQDG